MRKILFAILCLLFVSCSNLYKANKAYERGDYVENVVLTFKYFDEKPENFKELNEKKKNYLKAEWEPYAYMKLQFYYKNSKMIRLMTEELGKITGDVLFFNTDSGLFEYDLMRERIRSVSADELKHTLIKGMKVRV